MHYRRAFIPGATYFFTVVTEQCQPLFTSASAVDTLRNALRVVHATRPFQIDAMVVMPDHLHCIWTLPPNDGDFATRWRLIKTRFTKQSDPALRPPPNHGRVAKRAQALWQHRYWEHLIRDETDMHRHIEYIHYNPVKHGLVTTPHDWPYSSFHRYVEAGVYTAEWGRDEIGFDGVGRE